MFFLSFIQLNSSWRVSFFQLRIMINTCRQYELRITRWKFGSLSSTTKTQNIKNSYSMVKSFWAKPIDKDWINTHDHFDLLDCIHPLASIPNQNFRSGNSKVNNSENLDQRCILYLKVFHCYTHACINFMAFSIAI